MIKIRHVKNLIDEHRELPEAMIEYSGRTIAELAPEGSCLCLTVLAPTNRCIRGDASWNTIVPPDGSVLVFVETDRDPVTLAIITVGSLVAANAATAVGLATAASILGTIGMLGTVATFWGFAGQFLSSALAPSIAGPGGGNKISPTYGFGQPDNGAREGDAIQVVYGQTMVGGQIIQQWREATEDFDQRLNMLIAISDSRIKAIGQYDSATCAALTSDDHNGTTDGVDNLTGDDLPDGMLINGAAAKDFDEVTAHIRLGTMTQTVCPGFSEVIREQTKCSGFTLGSKRSNASYRWKTRTPVNAVRINMLFPNGIYKTDKESNKVKLDEYPKARVRIYETDGTTLVKEKEFRFNEAKTTPLNVTMEMEDLELREYIVDVKRTQRVPPAFTLKKPRGPYADRMDMVSILEVIYAPVAYRGIALLALTMKATDQISGSIPRVQSMVKGRMIDTGSGPVFTRNNAHVARDIATNRRYGGGNFFTDSDISPTFDDWADYCDELIQPWTDAPDYLAAVEGHANAGTDIAPVVSGSYTGADIAARGVYTFTLNSFVANTSAVIGWAFRSDDGEQTASGTLNFTDGSAQPFHNGLSLAIDNPDASTAGWYATDTWTVQILREERHRFDHVFDTQQPFFDALLLGVGPSGNAIMNKLGRTLSVIVERQRLPEQALGVWNIPNGGCRWSGDSRINRFNRITAEFPDAAVGYERQYTKQDEPMLSEATDSLREQTIRPTGVTRRTEAARHAARALRKQQRILVSGKITGLPLETIAFEPGDVIEVSEYRLESNGSATGRTAGTDGGNVVLDRDITFQPHVVYRYVEYSTDDTRRTRDFSYATETTTRILSFAPLDGGDGTGLRYMTGPRGTVSRDVVALSYTTRGDAMNSELEFSEYVDSVYTDEAEPQDPEIYAATIETAVAVTDIDVVETSVRDDVSTLTVSWAGASGASSYRVFSKVGSDSDNFGAVGQTSGTSIAFTTGAKQGEPVVILVQTLTASGGRTPIESSPTLTYTIRRIDGGTTLVLFPEAVENGAITPGSGNNATLDWDEVATDTNGDAMSVDGYVVRIGEWSRGPEIYRGTAHTLALKLPRTMRRYLIRAYKTQAGEDWYSPESEIVVSSPAAHASYSTVAVAATHVDLSEAARLKNLNPIEWFDTANDEAALQIEDDQSVEIISQPIDCGTPAATQVSVDPRVLTYMDEAGQQYYATMLHVGTSGPINRELIEWSLEVESSNDASSWTKYRSGGDSAGELLNTDIIINARYFRFRIRGEAIRFNTGGDEDDRPGRVLVEEIAYALYRA